MPTNTIRARLTRLDYETFACLMILLGFAVGAPIGILGFLSGLLGGEPTVDLGVVEIKGIGAGALALLWGPVFSVLYALFLSLLLYFPFRWTLRLVGGIRLRVEPEPRAKPA